MICPECATVGDLNRGLRDQFGGEVWQPDHPENCGCPCQHEEPREWGKQYSVERPVREENS